MTTEIQVGESWGDARARAHDGSDGDRFQPVDFGEPKGCGHVESMCPDCLPNWLKDYDVFLPCGCNASDVGARGHNTVIHTEGVNQ